MKNQGWFQKSNTYGQANKAENNGMWKGDKVGYIQLHDWIKSRLARPDTCEECHIKPPYDLANVTGVYNRELHNWKFLCRKCHMESDGRIFQITRRGDHLTEETKNKLRKPKSEETKRKISIAATMRYARVRERREIT